MSAEEKEELQEKSSPPQNQIVAVIGEPIQRNRVKIFSQARLVDGS